MKKFLSFIALFLGITIFSMAQSNITFRITSQNGKIFQQEKEVHCMTFGISGLNTDADVELFTKNFTSSPIVKQFEIFPGTNEQGERKARLVLNNKEKDTFVSLLKSTNVTTLNVDKKDYTPDQIDQISKDVKTNYQQMNLKSKEQKVTK